jgi:transcriptional regulator with PAS, ATPase and Fis domain
LEFFKNSLNKIILEKIINNSNDGIFVTDKTGTVLLSNTAAALPLQMTREEIIGLNTHQLLKDGVIDRSTTIEAIEARKQITGIVNLPCGEKGMSTSTPLFDDNGEIIMIITNTRSQDLIEYYISAVDRERNKAANYKSVINYISESQKNVLIAESPQMKRIVGKAELIARADSTVLILGDSGTGKEVVARFIHNNSYRKNEPFIAVNCAAIPQELMESEFFGYEKGAFSGADIQGKMGLFQMANKGTLFLDEIAELPLAMQAKLLRVLETFEFRRLGGTTTQYTNIRLIAATNRNLKKLVQENLFRNDLYYRLNVIPITLPPLRERLEDIIALADYFLRDFNKKYGLVKKFSAKTIQAFQSYSWPGNIRELRNIIERLIITSCNKEELELDFELGNDNIDTINAPLNKEEMETLKIVPNGTLKETLGAVEQQYINQMLEKCNGRIGETADRLGIHRTVLYKKIKNKHI